MNFTLYKSDEEYPEELSNIKVFSLVLWVNRKNIIIFLFLLLILPMFLSEAVEILFFEYFSTGLLYFFCNIFIAYTMAFGTFIFVYLCSKRISIFPSELKNIRNFFYYNRVHSSHKNYYFNLLSSIFKKVISKLWYIYLIISYIVGTCVIASMVMGYIFGIIIMWGNYFN